MGDFGSVWDPAALGNYDTSRLPVDLIIVHHTACPLSAALARFQQPGTQVSAHFIVAQDGMIYETVAIGNTAYHSGDYTINRRSIGIEHESGPVGQDFFTDVQYESSRQLCSLLALYFGFPLDWHHLWPHYRVVATACPGVLDLNRILTPAVPVPQPQPPIGDDEMAYVRNPNGGAEFVIGAEGKRHIEGAEDAVLRQAGVAFKDLAADPNLGTVDQLLAAIPDYSPPAAPAAPGEPDLRLLEVALPSVTPPVSLSSAMGRLLAHFGLLSPPAPQPPPQP